MSSATRPFPARILLAEDDRDLRAGIAAALRGDGHEVVEARDGGRLLVRIGTAYATRRPHESYDLVVSDVRMPVCSGLQILEGLRRAHWSTPVVLMTAFADASTRARATSFGALVLEKPLDVDDLRAVVLEVLSRTGEPFDREAGVTPA